MRKDSGFGLIRAKSFHWIVSIHCEVFSAACEVFLSRLGLRQSGKEKGKWRENVDRVLYSGGCRARWKIVIGGKSNICSFLSYT